MPCKCGGLLDFSHIEGGYEIYVCEKCGNIKKIKIKGIPGYDK